MATNIKIENATSINCFVPFCSSKKSVDGNPIHFFQVPPGNEGLSWKVNVNSIQSQHDRKIGILGRTISPSTLYCCELHFNIETDSTITIDSDGSVECNIKPGRLPSTKPTRSKRLWQIIESNHRQQLAEMSSTDHNNDLLEPSKRQDQHDGDTLSIVDMSTLICKNFKDITIAPPHDLADQTNDPIDIKYTPMMPLTVELMRRKSFYYMGLEQSVFFRLLDIIKSTTGDMTDSLLTEARIMLCLRKHRLNEEFEALGDLFDMDEATAERYCAESTNLVSNLYNSFAYSISSPVAHESNDIKSSLCTDDRRVVDDEDDDDDEPRIYKYKRQISEDSDVYSSDLEASEESESDDCESESDISTDLDLDDKQLVKETVQCPLCYRNVGRLEYHMENVHWNPTHLNKTVCGLCFAKCRTHKHLLDHQQQMHNRMGCMCDVCGKMFGKVSAVKEHVLKVHSKCKPYLCHHCGEGYFSLAKLKNHTEHAHLQIRNHECTLCDKKYFQAGELENHIRSAHTKERPFHCRFGCGKSFCRSGSRHTHEQMHKSKFSCEICLKVFSFRHNLQTHCKNIHGKNVIDTEKCKIEIINQ